MLHIHQISYGWEGLVVPYLISVLGSYLGLQCAVRARTTERPRTWTAAAALAIGGGGVWTTHFVAMLGFAIDGTSIRYDVPITLLTAIAAVAVVWVALLIVQADDAAWRLPAAGLLTGSGVTAMHYFGMYAMNTDAQIRYSWPLVGLSVIIAMIAATAALWFTLNVRGVPAALGAALIMGVAVCGMHYTGMYAISAQHLADARNPSGADALDLLAPLMQCASAVTLVLLIYVGLTDADELRRTHRSEPSAKTPDSHPGGSDAIF
ncbi:MHYT domain-containing protein [Nocardia stercoris]|uniref:MHYT domain-containing protein n=1 Tax=Nocardia stercoris TaxID=2483361 RepID=A0A3M2L0R4_9NOCA|nr:MHYT domain-containing protein [Nocardia stercoris]RMI30083.1 hypothetical protein EBN03_22910 [Nocardia stercoris]